MPSSCLRRPTPTWFRRSKRPLRLASRRSTAPTRGSPPVSAAPPGPPQTRANLVPAVEAATEAGIPVLNVNDAVIPSAEHYVGNVQTGNGVNAAQGTIDKSTDGGEVGGMRGP